MKPSDTPTPERRAPVQGFAQGIPWWMHLKAFEVYAAKYGTSQSAERLAERGGFGVAELDRFIPGWSDELDHVKQLEKRLTQSQRELAETRRVLEKCQDALKWCLEKEPSPCRCMDFAIPPHACVAHLAIDASTACLAKEVVQGSPEDIRGPVESEGNAGAEA